MNGTNTNSTDDLGDVIAFVGNVVVSGSVLSGVAAIWVIGCLIHLKMIKKMAFRFLLYLMIADIFMSAAFFPRYPIASLPQPPGFGCQWQAFLSVFSANVIPFWHVAMSTFIGYTLFTGHKPSVKFEIGCNLIIWNSGLLLASIGYAIGGPNWYVPIYGGASCYISDQYTSLRVWFLHFWIGLTILYLLFVYISIGVYVYKGTSVESLNREREEAKKKG